MNYNRLTPNEECETCELKQICDIGYVSAPSYSIITCEAFRAAVKQFGGKEKLEQYIFEKLEEFKDNKMEEFNYDDESVAFNRFLQSDPLGTVSAWSNQDGFILHTPNVPPKGHGQNSVVRITGIH